MEDSLTLSRMETVGLFIYPGWLVVYSMDDFEFEGFGVVLVCHVAGDDAL